MTSPRNLLHLFLFAYGFMLSGAFLTLMGTTLPDLECLFHSDLQTVSRLFLAAGIPMIAASILPTFLMKKGNLYLWMAAAMFLFGGSLSLVTATGYIQVAVTALICTGIANAVQMNGAVLMCNLLFPTSDYVFHVLTAALSTGSLLCPVIAKPFLGKTRSIVASHISLRRNITTLMSKGGPYSAAQRPNDYNVSLNSSFYCETTESSIQYLYITWGLSAFPMVVCFCICFLKFKYQSEDIFQSKTDQYINMTEKRSMVEVVCMVLFIVSLPCPYGLAYTYGSYLTTLGINSSLHLGVQRMAFLASMFWLSFLVARLMAIGCSLCTKHVVILYISLIGQIASVAVLILTDGTVETSLWIGSLSLAFTNGPQFASLVSWSRDYILWTPLVVGLICMADFVGVTFLPYISGQIMSFHGQKWNLYYCLGLAVFEFIVVCTLHCIGRHGSKDKEKMIENEGIDMH